LIADLRLPNERQRKLATGNPAIGNHQETRIMMAKMFYTLDEAKAALGKNEEEIKQFAREGRLREFRDGPRLMFKADQVEALKAELGGGGMPRDQVDLGVSDTGAPIGLVDSQRSSGGSGISLVDSDMGGRSPMGSAGGLKDDTALAADLGLSGSMGGVPSPGRPGSGGGLSSGSGIAGIGGSRSGINVLGESEAGADPGAQTAINQSVSDQVNLEGVGSGSGLLDLTRESDDTSLGAELLDEISPAGSRRGSGSGTAVAEGSAVVGGTAGGTAIAAATPTARARGGVAVPTYIEAPDALGTALGAACLGAAIVMLLAIVSLFAGVLNTRPSLLNMVAGDGVAKNGLSFFMIAAIGVGVAFVFFLFGLFIGKARA
jgi:hypothetical protein